MPRRDANKAVTAKMYRHFAVVTIVATVALAIATSDSNADQFNASVDSQKAAFDATGKEIGKNAQPKIVRRVDKVSKTPRAATGWGYDEGGDGSGGGGVSTSYVRQGIGVTGLSPELLRQLNMTAEQFNALPSEEKVRLLNRSKSGNALSEAEQARRQQAVAATSLERSGFEGPCNDC